MERHFHRHTALADGVCLADVHFVHCGAARAFARNAMHRAVTVSAVFGLLFAALLVLLPSGLRESVFALVLGLFQLGALFMMLWACRRGDRFAPWLMLAGTLVLVAAE